MHNNDDVEAESIRDNFNLLLQPIVLSLLTLVAADAVVVTGVGVNVPFAINLLLLTFMGYLHLVCCTIVVVVVVAVAVCGVLINFVW